MTNLNRTHPRRLSLATFAALFAIFTAGCDSHKYTTESQPYIAATTQILISAGRCMSPTDCSQKQLLKTAAGGYSLGPLHGGGVHVNIYQIAASDAPTWQSLSNAFSTTYESSSKIPVTLTLYAGPHHNPGPATHKLVFPRN